jgi:hypothetical protein
MLGDNYRTWMCLEAVSPVFLRKILSRNSESTASASRKGWIGDATNGSNQGEKHMTKDDIIRMAQSAGVSWSLGIGGMEDFLERFAHLVAAHERKELEQELLKLRKGVASTSDYIQGRWDLIGEFQDAIRARGNNDKPV